MEERNYKKFAEAIDKALKQFEFGVSDWPDIISALGKLGKVCLCTIDLVLK